MKKLSYWSKNNPVKARIIIGLSHVMLLIIGISMGIMTYMDDFQISNKFLMMMVCIFFVVYMFYPVRGRKTGVLKYSFYRRVKHDFILVMASTCVLASGVNHFAFQPLESQQTLPQVRLMVVTGNLESPGFMKKEWRKNLLKQLKQLRTDTKQALKSMKSDAQVGNGKKAGVKIFLIFLTILTAVILFGLVGSLACNLSCSGQEGLALIVLFGGSAAIIGLSIMVISKITKIGKPRQAPVKTEEGKVISSGT